MASADSVHANPWDSQNPRDLPRQQYKVIGTRPIRHDGADKVTGRAKFGADIQLPGMLHGAIARSPHAHAKIKSIDTSKAESLPGVHAVLTRADMPEVGSKVAELGEGFFDLRDLSRNVLADDKVMYKGHPVAAVAADNVHVARQAADLIEVEYEVLPPVLDVREAMRDDAPILHDDLRTEQVAAASDEPGDKPTNVAKHYCHEKGDVADGFARAKVIVEREFTTSPVHQGYIEPHTATALWNPDGHVTVWTTTQGAFVVRSQLSSLLQEPISRIKVVPMEVGGAFGGKIVVYVSPIAALLSKKTGRPVKVVMSYAEVLEASGPTPGSYMRVKMGADAEGRLTAAEAYLVFEAGGFPGSAVFAACITVFACYEVPAGRIDGYDVVLNKSVRRAYRAPCATQAAFAVEPVVDEICEQLNLDPLEFRARNAAKEGTRRIDGLVNPRIGMSETVEAIKNSEHWKTPLEGPHRGRGVASGYWMNVGLASSATASVNPDGTVSLVEGSSDLAGTRTSLAMQMAEALGIAAEDVNPSVADTDGIGYTNVTGGSRVTYATGWAVYEAARDIQRQMVQRAASIWEVDESEVRYEDGKIIGPGELAFTFQELAAKLNTTGGPITGRGSSDPTEPGGAYATHVVDVEVDPETGKVDVLRYTAAQDAGTAIHPSYVEGQMQGGAVQGIGWALHEEYVYDDQGVMQNTSLLDYRTPTCCDVPMIDTIIVEVPNPGHPYGVRGVGEVPIVPPPAALANAVYQAIGVRMYELPMSPPRVLHEILKQRESHG